MQQTGPWQPVKSNRPCANIRVRNTLFAAASALKSPDTPILAIYHKHKHKQNPFNMG